MNHGTRTDDPTNLSLNLTLPFRDAQLLHLISFLKGHLHIRQPFDDIDALAAAIDNAGDKLVRNNDVVVFIIVFPVVFAKDVLISEVFVCFLVPSLDYRQLRSDLNII